MCCVVGMHVKEHQVDEINMGYSTVASVMPVRVLDINTTYLYHQSIYYQIKLLLSPTFSYM